MRELVLVLPDFFMHAAAVPQAPPSAALTTLRFPPPRPLRGGWRGMLARGVGRADLALVDAASIIAAANAIPAANASSTANVLHAAAPSEAWLATPLHLMAGLKTLHFPANGILRLPPAEALELAESFAKVFGADELALQPADSAGFVLSSFSAPGAETVDPARLIGEGIETLLPSGAESAALRALTSEIEMWLHDLPLNRRRELRGEPRVSTLWLWGGGAPPRDPIVATPAAPEARFSRLVADDIWVRSIARLAGLECAPLVLPLESLHESAADDEATVCVVAPLAGVSPEIFDREVIAPAAAALAAGRLERFAVVANDRSVSASVTDRYRFWRPLRSVFAAIADSA
ncbi:MAG: hypothetical protein ACKOCF_05815 [Gammaproteobacteria bacterium]